MHQCDFDLCIIGAGIIGISVAYQAQQEHPEWKILLLDQQEAARGATQYAAALDSTIGSCNNFVREIATQSRNSYLELKKTIKDFKMRAIPIFYAVGEDSVNRLQEKCLRELSPLDSSQQAMLLETSPWFNLPQNYELFYGGDATIFSPYNAATSLLHAVKQSSKFTFLSKSKVTQIQQCDNGWLVGVAGNDSRTAARCVICTGPWELPFTVKDLNLDVGTKVKKVVSYKIDRPTTLRMPTIYLPDDGAFFSPTYEADRIILSITSPEWGCEPDLKQLKEKTFDVGIKQDLIQKFAPVLSAVQAEPVIFCDGYTDDRVPMIKKIADHLIFTGGASGRGFRFAPGIAKHVLGLLACNPKELGSHLEHEQLRNS